ncbi:type II toxin-antitoxin system VapC family toxin [Runella limosa]|uniref:type II toxin-antitoxin system VapC family toxin n=1 Tax=Runella limosa TaxID=370978 RepID=UPI0004919C84|nr:type II toxin-antitoxin system VapC family toxin [Runella limosa]
MGEKFLIDTNAASDYLGGRLPVGGLQFMDTIVNDAPIISIINRIELLGHNQAGIEKFKILVASCIVVELTESVILKVIAIRKSRRIKIPDAIIAATALVYDLTLITHNLSDFEGISGLKIIDAHLL